jgi:hypothetical protein
MCILLAGRTSHSMSLLGKNATESAPPGVPREEADRSLPGTRGSCRCRQKLVPTVRGSSGFWICESAVIDQAYFGCEITLRVDKSTSLRCSPTATYARCRVASTLTPSATPENANAFFAFDWEDAAPAVKSLKRIPGELLVGVVEIRKCREGLPSI